MSCIEKKIRFAATELISPGDRVVVAVSGGVDSMALLYLLNSITKEIACELFVAHLNHSARGEESDGDADFVADVANKLSLPCFIEKLDIAYEKSILRTSFQESARILRYQFLEKTLLSVKGHKIAVGHTADDQAETVLMNLIRGSGLRGLAGITRIRGSIIRPLLECTRTELELFLKKHNLTHRTDSSNHQNKYLRNRVRHDLLPVLNEFNAGVAENLVGLADIVRAEDDWMAEQTQTLFTQLVVVEGVELSILIGKFEAQPLAMKRRLVRQALLHLKGDLRSISSYHVQQILDLFSQAKVGRELSLPENLRVYCGYDRVSFSVLGDSGINCDNDSDIKPEITHLKIPGVTQIAESDIELHARLIEPPVDFSESITKYEAFLDLEKTGENIHIRFIQPGDQFIPLGMKGRKKLKSYFIDRKIPRKLRPKTPILVNAEGEIIWVYGEQISDLFCVTEETRKILFLKGIDP